MPAKITEFATDYDEIDRWNGGVGWIPHSEEFMQRASHALAIDDGVWVVDPVDAEGVDELVAEYGEVAGVVVLSDYHTRDSDVFGRRHGVSVQLPADMDGVADELDAPTERLKIGEEIGGYELLGISDSKSAFLQEYALYDGETLVVSESLGTAPYFRVSGERLGVPPLLRLNPPSEAFEGLEPDRLLTGHGEGIDENVADALEDALSNSRRRLPRALLSHGGKQIRTLTAAILK